MFSMRFCDALLPALAVEFDASVGDTAAVLSGFALAYGLSQFFYGPAGDRHGKLRVVASATLACAGAHMAAVMAPSLGILVLARMLCGATAAGIIPLSMAWIGDHVPYAARQVYLARLLGATVTGMIAGQWLGGVVAVTVGWRAGFAAMTLMFLLAGLGLRQQATTSRPTPAKPPVRWSVVLRERWARTVLLLTLTEGALVYGALGFVPQRLHSDAGLSLPTAGASLAMFGLGGLAYTRCARQLLPRLGETGLAQLGGACLAAGYGLLAWLPVWTVALPACALAGFGFYALHNTLQVHATQMVPTARGTAVALFSCSLFVGQSAGVSTAAWAVDRGAAVAVFAVAAVALLGLGFAVGQVLRRQTVRLGTGS